MSPMTEKNMLFWLFWIPEWSFKG